jgi:O-antigen ligase
MPIYQDYTDLIAFLPDLFLIATLSVWLLSLLLTRRKPHFKPVALTIAIGFLLLVVAASSISSGDRILSGYYLLRTIGLFGLYLFLVNEFHDLKLISGALLASIFLQSMIAIGQAWQQSSLGLGFLGELNLDPAASGVSVIGTNEIRTLRSYGLADHPNILGGSLALSLILLVGWLVQRDGQKGDGASIRPIQLPAIMVFSIGCLALYFTYSRSAWLALGVAALFGMALLWFKAKAGELQRFLAILAAALLLILPIAVQNLTFLGVRFNVQGSFGEVFYERESLSERRSLNQAGNQIFASNALLGVGPGAFPKALVEHAPEFPFDYQPPHLILLEAAAETGIFGGLALTGILLFPWIALWINRKHLSFDANLIFASAAFLGVTLIGIFDYYPWLLAPGRYWLWTIWGIWGAVYIRSYKRQAHD